MFSKLNKLKRDQEGATAVEYALIVSAIAAAIAAIVFLLGAQVSGLFENVSALWTSQS